MESLSKWTDINKLSLGDQITVLDGTVICKKYIPRSNHKKSNNGPKVKTPNLKNKFPYFKEHADTEQLAYNLNAFKCIEYNSSCSSNYFPFFDSRSRSTKKFL